MDTGGSIFAPGFNSGDDIPIPVIFFQSDNLTPIDMTGQTVGITIKEALTDANGNPVPDSQAIFSQDLPGDTSGTFSFLIPGFTLGNPTLLPGNYFVDCKKWDLTGKRSTVFTSSLPINESVTLRATP